LLVVHILHITQPEEWIDTQDLGMPSLLDWHSYFYPALVDAVCILSFVLALHILALYIVASSV
jgi:hypothetical protein